MKVNFCILVLGFICSAVMANDKFIPIPPLNSFGVNSGYSGMPQAPEPPAVPVDGSGSYKAPEFKMTESVSKKSNTKTEQKKSDVNEGLVAAGLLSSTGSLSGASSYLDTLLRNSYGNLSVPAPQTMSAEDFSVPFSGYTDGSASTALSM